MRRTRRDRPAPVWTRQRLLALLLSAAVLGCLLLAGVVYAVVSALPSAGSSRAAATSPAGGVPGPARALSTGAPTTLAEAQDALAQRGMPTVDDDAMQPAPVSTRDPGASLLVPLSTSVGPAGVPTGFPQTAAGALAQLGAIDQAAVQSGSLAGARAVLAGWGVPGGPSGSSWTVVRALADIFSGAGLSGGGSPELVLRLTPVMGVIKGTVGAGFVVPCVDFELDATLDRTVRVGVADCQRMTWTQGRWMIGAGAEPADPPAVWPDTDTAFAVGYRDLSHG